MQNVLLDASFRPSSNVVARIIADEIVIVPLTAGVANMEDQLFSLNETGRTVWEHMVKGETLKQIITELEASFDAPAGTIEKDVLGLIDELEKQGIVERNAA